MSFLEIRDLGVTFSVEGRVIEAVRGIDLDVDRGETVALVGESGSGKSVTALSVLQLLPYPVAAHPSGSIRVGGQEMIGAPPAVLHDVRGDQVSMVFQEPMTALNPLHKVEKQINETLLLHQGLLAEAARARTVELMNLVGLRDTDRILDGNDIVAINLEAFNPGGDAFLGKGLGRGLQLGRDRDGPLVVVDHGDHRQVPGAGGVDAFIKFTFRGAALADLGQHRPALFTAQLDCRGNASGM